MPDSGHVEFRIADRVAIITFNRSRKKNAFTHAMYEQFAAAMHEAEHESDVRVIVLTGAGGAFTSGNDLHDFMHNPPSSGESPVWKVIRALAFAEKPLVAAVEGVAVGIGATMLMHCDLVYAARDVRFGLPFVGLGLTPEAGSSLLLPRLAGLQRASQLLLLQEFFDSDTALEIGLVTRVFEHGEALEAALESAGALADKPPGAVRATKRLLREPIRRQLESVLQDEGVTFVTCLGSPEAHEAFSAFFEKRKPDFSGF